MPTYPTITATNLELTPMQVKFDGIDLGATLSNVVITTKYTKADLKADQFGSTTLDRRVSGMEVSVTTDLAEIQNIDIWKVVFPHATVIAGPPKAIQFNTNIGDGDLTNAKGLVLHPLSKAAADNDADYTFFKACASADSTITYGPTEQSKLKVVWNILPDTSVTPAKFFRFGDPASV